MYELRFMWRHSTLIAGRRSLAASIQKPPHYVVKPVSIFCCVAVSGETIKLSKSLRSTVEFLYEMFIKVKKMLLFNFIFDLL
jgi:hypothetical protein